mgnify:CR=1 FL=1
MEIISIAKIGILSFVLLTSEVGQGIQEQTKKRTNEA